MGQKFPVFIEKMDVKYFMKNCDQGTKCYTVGMAKNAVGVMFTKGLKISMGLSSLSFYRKKRM